MKAVIIAAGDPPSSKVVIETLKDCDISIAADNGIAVFKVMDILPDIIIGDIDSSYPELIDYYVDKGSKTIILEKEKNMTDSEAAVDTAVCMGCDKIVMLGALGGRTDHTIANLMLLRGAYESGYNLKIEDDTQEIYVDGGDYTIKGNIGQTFSLFPTDTEAMVKSYGGVYYPLDNLNLKNMQSRGISNILTDRIARMHSDKPLLIIKNKT